VDKSNTFEKYDSKYQGARQMDALRTEVISLLALAMEASGDGQCAERTVEVARELRIIRPSVHRELRKFLKLA
jgi:hypothetical protein